jgi:hypothetical protein
MIWLGRGTIVRFCLISHPTEPSSIECRNIVPNCTVSISVCHSFETILRHCSRPRFSRPVYRRYRLRAHNMMWARGGFTDLSKERAAAQKSERRTGILYHLQQISTPLQTISCCLRKDDLCFRLRSLIFAACSFSIWRWWAAHSLSIWKMSATYTCEFQLVPSNRFGVRKHMTVGQNTVPNQIWRLFCIAEHSNND